MFIFVLASTNSRSVCMPSRCVGKNALIEMSCMPSTTIWTCILNRNATHEFHPNGRFVSNRYHRTQFVFATGAMLEASASGQSSAAIKTYFKQENGPRNATQVRLCSLSLTKYHYTERWWFVPQKNGTACDAGYQSCFTILLEYLVSRLQLKLKNLLYVPSSEVYILRH